MTRQQRRAAEWRRIRALVLAAVVFVGGFGLPAFDVLAYHWNRPAAAAPDGRPHLQQFGTPAEHTVQCVLTHHAPAPRAATALAVTVHSLAATRVTRTSHPTAVIALLFRHSPDQPRAPPASIA